MKKILFINLYFKTGGVETLLLRIISAMEKYDYRATVLLLKKEYNQELLEQLQAVADVHFLTDVKTLRPAIWRKRLGDDFDYIFATINDALLLGSMLHRWVYPKAKLMVGVYQTEIFCAPVTWRYLHRKVINDLFCYGVPNKNKIIANEAGRDHHAKLLNYDLSDVPIVPLIVDVEKYYPPQRQVIDRHKIVSIGRLVDFKTYNLTFLPVLRQLIDSGHPFKWHVYGEGPLQQQMELEIARLNLTEHVVLHGNLDYSQFKQVVSDAFVFIGSGTAIIEAAACGVPVIPAMEYATEATSYGFFHEIEGISFFEPGLLATLCFIDDLILQLKALNDVEYDSLIQMSLNKSELFMESSVVSLYNEAFMASKSLPSCLPVSYVFDFIWRYALSNILSYLGVFNENNR